MQGFCLQTCADVPHPLDRHLHEVTSQISGAGAWAAFADGCCCDRPTLETIEAQMRVESVEWGRWRGMPALVKPLVWGRAVAS